jgi:hypothetical protein
VKENRKIMEQIENKNKREQESMTHNNANLSIDLTMGAAISTGKGGDLQVAFNLTGGWVRSKEVRQNKRSLLIE